MHARALRKIFRRQLNRSNVRVLLPHILTILNSDSLQHAHNVGRVYERDLYFTVTLLKRWSHDMDYFQLCSCLETNTCVLFFTISLTLSKLS